MISYKRTKTDPSVLRAVSVDESDNGDWDAGIGDEVRVAPPPAADERCRQA